MWLGRAATRKIPCPHGPRPSPFGELLRPLALQEGVRIGLVLHGRRGLVLHGRPGLVLHGRRGLVLHGRIGLVLHGRRGLVLHGRIGLVLHLRWFFWLVPHDGTLLCLT